MKLLNEEQLLDPAFRAKVLKEIKSPWNIARKNESNKRQEVYKDKTVKYVMLKLKRELKLADTLTLIENRASNISICKKIINKIGRVYAQPPKRETGNEKSDLQIEELAKLLNFNTKQKKVDRLTRLHKNCMPWFYPEAIGDGTYRLCQKVLNPSQFDVIPKANNPLEPGCVILNDFRDSRDFQIPIGSGPQVTALEGSRVRSETDPTIAVGANAIDADENKIFIWWSNKYHFTTDNKGNIIKAASPEDYLNPIEIIPGVSSAEDQDESYWADGGEDLVDGAILINTMITDRNAILFIQGWGQMVITGTKIPDEFIAGPHHAMVLRYDKDKGEEKPEVSFVTSGAPLADWMSTIEQTVALLLSTNNLSPSTVAGKLDPNQLASGIAMLIDRSDSTDSITDKQTEFYWIELKEWEIIKRFQNLYSKLNILSQEFKAVGPIAEDVRVQVKFPEDSGEIVSRSDDLDNKKKEKEIGVSSVIDLIMKENPGMNRQDAEKRALEIKDDNEKFGAAPPKIEDPNAGKPGEDPLKNNPPPDEKPKGE